MAPKYPQQLDNGHFTVQKLLGEGCFGAVFLGTDTHTGSEVAIKFEDSNSVGAGSLQSEAKLLQKITDGPPGRLQGFTQVFFLGRVNGLTCMVMDRLGLSLEDAMKACKDKVMDARSVVLVGQQAMHRIEYLHSKGIVHRDIKPENFMYGVADKIHHLYLIDFGLCEPFYARKHVAMRRGNSMVGTARYCSINCHNGLTQSRRDDLEAIGNMMVFFCRGSLPWSGLKGAKTDEEKYAMIGKKKESINLDELCAGFPRVVQEFLTYGRSLAFAERPDYERLQHKFKKAREETEVRSDHDVQWLSDVDSEQLTPIQEWSAIAQPDDLDGQLSRNDGGMLKCFSFNFFGGKSTATQVMEIPPSSQAKRRSE
eukprot:TRINITY_DN10887_c0_g1_i1.p1 TRINITY_DN10887_c0_g1~~TRINITY_DN10887_c0_g1_i1.p1  ORF type:complete len:368 (-),score=78.71 TRINITY_DN10887_c0_g1_i1:144-1247(-)